MADIKPNNQVRGNPLVNYFNESKSELQKVTWPTRKTLINHTLTVIALCLGLAVFIGAVDFALNYGVKFLLK